jgi:hypothetical protein
MASPDWSEAKLKVLAAWSSLTVGGKIAVAIALAAVYGAGWLTGGATIGWLVRLAS